MGPLLLKEFKGRWYVLAVKPETKELRCFGLDRITDLAPSPRSFTIPGSFEASTYYEQAFGIIRPDDEQPQEVVLSLTPTQGRYVLSYPLHSSQQLLSHSETETRIRLQTFDTHDLRMELLSMGEEVEVLAPAGLREWIGQIVKTVAAAYQSKKADSK